jgi:hypothetical protein
MFAKVPKKNSVQQCCVENNNIQNNIRTSNDRLNPERKQEKFQFLTKHKLDDTGIKLEETCKRICTFCFIDTVKKA